MTDKVRLSGFDGHRLMLVLYIALGMVVGVFVGWFLAGQVEKAQEESIVTAESMLVSPTPEPSPSPFPTCQDQMVVTRLESTLAALNDVDIAKAQEELSESLSAYADLAGTPGCDTLARDLLSVQALVSASVIWNDAWESGSVVQGQQALQLANQALSLAFKAPVRELANDLLETIQAEQQDLSALLDPGREISKTETLETEAAGGFFPLCSINTLIKPVLEEETGSQAAHISRLAIISDTLFALAGGRLTTIELDRVHGPSPALFIRPEPEDTIVAGAKIGELIDITPAANGDLLVLEKSGRLFRRSLSGEWELERQVQPGEMPVSIAPYTTRSYLLDPVANQIWRYSPEESAGGNENSYFSKNAIRNVSQGIDMAIDGAIYVARNDGWVRRYYVGVEDSSFLPDTDLGQPVDIFLPDEPDSSLVYVVDGPGRRLLGLDRETGSYRLGFSVNVQDARSLTSGAIHGGRLYLSDGERMFISILSPTPVTLLDCPALPFLPDATLGRQELDLELQIPVDSTLPMTASLYPGGRWPQFGYGVLDGILFDSLPFSDTIRAIAPGTISRIVKDPTLILESDLGVISTTHVVPDELNDALWGTQVWIDLGNGVEARYGGLAAILPSLSEGNEIRRLAILGFAGDEPVLLGLYVDGEYLGKGWSAPETVVAYRSFFTQN